MTVFTSVNSPEIVRILLQGGIGVVRTDTLYGLIACAADEAAVNKVYALKDRSAHKSPIVLIHDTSQLFDTVSSQTEQLLGSVWPGPVSVILPSTQAPTWIRRENDSVAYRQPNDQSLSQLLARSGPLIAPSANPEGESPAMNIAEAKAYFGNSVDFYIDGGQVMDGTPSQLIRVNQDGSTDRLR